MQSQGTLSETSLRNLLETAQGERATGILTVRDGSRAATLYFLFGSLVHAESGEQSGDEAVIAALGWGEGDFTFDSKAKLPADETVTGTLADLISAADAAARDGAGAEALAEAESEADAEPEPEPEAEAEPEPAAVIAAESPVPEPVAEAPTIPPAAVPTPAAPGRRETAAEHVPQPRRGVKHRPEPRHGREPIPVPAGEVTYDSLKTSFVDFPRLVTTLERDGYTGYVRLLTEEASGLIFFKEGHALECVYDAGELLLGSPALREFNDQVVQGLGVLDVVGLSPEVVDGLHELTVARPLYTELYASWVDFPSLLGFLAERHHTGSVTVRTDSKTGVIILTAGDVTGAYTSESRDISNQVDEVRGLCQDKNAMIEVKAAEPASHTPLNVDAIVGSRALPGNTLPPAPVPVPVPVAEAPTLPPQPAPVAEAEPEPEPAPEPSPGDTLPGTAAATIPPVAAPVADSANVDWEDAVAQLQQLAEDSLGNRSRKVKDILAAAERSRAGLERAIDEIPTISLLFVDSSRLEALAQEMRTRLQSLS